jgi:HD-GYP domain-containing protein (c-di-GMP phosphodiesterase class II)
MRQHDTAMYDHDDVLRELNSSLPIRDKLHSVHQVLRRRFDCIDRVAVAIYDPKTDLLKTFVDSSGGDSPLQQYEATLSKATSLQDIIRVGRPRVVQDIEVFARGTQEHTHRIRKHGYKSSYTMPMYLDGTFFGFVFFNSLQGDPFNDESLHYLDIFGHLISLVVISEISQIHTLLGAIKSARAMTHHRDLETGAHLDRMAHYSQLIARELAGKYGFTDEYIEHIFLFAPLHDIGKIGIPDRILLKPGQLSDTERTEMQSHTQKGRQIIDEMLNDFGLGAVAHVELLRNIAQFHHETLDGAGYPSGLKGENIPVEARIIAVADIFDALTSARPYKSAWSIDEAYAALRKLAGLKLDADCVGALVNNRAKIEQIQKKFAEDSYG